MTTDIVVIIRDLRGYRLGIAVRCDMPVYHMADGSRLSVDVYPAHEENLKRLRNGVELVPIGSTTYQWPLRAEMVAQVLDEMGYGVDDELRLQRRLADPFPRIELGHIGPMIMVHLATCAARLKEAGKEMGEGISEAVEAEAMKRPANIAWLADEKHPDGCLVFVDSFPDKMGLLPKQDEDPGRLGVLGRQLCLSWHDYTLIPKSGNVYLLYKYLNTEPAPFDTLQDMDKAGYFVAADGVLCRKGDGKLGIADVSIDDFLK
jgi:hypothetical protein